MAFLWLAQTKQILGKVVPQNKTIKIKVCDDQNAPIVEKLKRPLLVRLMHLCLKYTNIQTKALWGILDFHQRGIKCEISV